jgi:hypothetical protein
MIYPFSGRESGVALRLPPQSKATSSNAVCAGLPQHYAAWQAEGSAA